MLINVFERSINRQNDKRCFEVESFQAKYGCMHSATLAIQRHSSLKYVPSFKVKPLKNWATQDETNKSN